MNSIISSLVYTLISCLMLFFSRILFDKISFFKIEEQIKEKNATALLSFAGYIIGIAIILVGAFVGPSAKSFKADIILYCVYACIGIGLMSLSGFIVDKIMLNKFDCKKELLEDGNIGTAAVYFGFYISTGLIISACVNGEYGGIISSIIYYILGMLFLFIFLKVYDAITPYSIHKELENDNFAVGIALAGNIIAMGIILMKATLGDVAGIRANAILYLVDLTAVFLLLPFVRLILGNIIVKSIKINAEIKNGNSAAGLLEFASIICFAILIFFMIDFTSVL